MGFFLYQKKYNRELVIPSYVCIKNNNIGLALYYQYWYINESEVLGSVFNTIINRFECSCDDI